MKIILKFGLGIIFQCLSIFSYGQDIPVTIQKLTDGVLQMPSQAGASGGSAFLAYRKGSDLAGAPTVQVAGGHLLVAKNKIGIGLNTYLEQINFIRNASFNFVLAYHLPITKKATTSFGINTEYHYFSINTSQLNGSVDMQDPLVVNFQPSTRLDFSPGIAINHSKYFIGITLNRIRTLMEPQNKNARLRSFYTFFVGYRYSLNSKNLLEPLIIARYDPIQEVFQNDYQLFYTYNQSVMAGFTYRGSQVYAASLGYIFSKRLVVGYTYQFVTGNVSSIYHTNTHEISLRFNLNKQYYNQPMFLPEQRPVSNVTKEKLN